MAFHTCKLGAILLLCVLFEGLRADNSTEISTDDKTGPSSVEANIFCDISDNCTHSMVCIDNLCRCKPDHKWDQLRGKCESYNCATDRHECGKDDPHRECRHTLFGSKCECMHGYEEDRRNHKCRKFCHNNNDCANNDHMVCVDLMCRCRPNYRWNASAMSCQSFNCTKDAECWSGSDENRECIDSVCECSFQEDLTTTQCYLSLYSLFRIRNYTTRKEKILLLTVFIVPAVLLCCLHSYYKKRRLNKAMPKLIETNQKNAINYIYFPRNQEMKVCNQKE